jgi:hypothetical protein
MFGQDSLDPRDRAVVRQIGDDGVAAVRLGSPPLAGGPLGPHHGKRAPSRITVDAPEGPPETATGPGDQHAPRFVHARLPLIGAPPGPRRSGRRC